MFALLSAARKAVAPRRFAAGRRRFVLALPVLGLAAACQPVSMNGASGPALDASQPVPVALLVPKGSGQSGDAILSQSLENSARLAASELNGVQIDLRVYDTKGDPGTTQAVTAQAIDEGAKIILGPVYAADANAAGHIAKARGVNVLAFSNNASIAGGNVFILGPTFQNTADRLTAYAAAQGRSRIVVVHANTPEGQAGASAIQGAAQRYGATIASSVPYEFSQQGVTKAIPSIVSAAGNGQADAIFLTANTAGALPMLTRMLPQQGLGTDTIQYMGLTRWDIPSQTLHLPGVQGGWFAIPDPNLTAQFIQRYRAAYGGDPHPIGGLAFDGINAIGALIQQGGRDPLSAAALTQNAGFQGVGGAFRFRTDGTNERALAVATVRDNQVAILDPAPRSFSGMGF
ncbi:penicillin-binding protein activator [Pseudooceanicola sp. CBS1P-1]|uniref:ABC transporter substrate-binding protein n=1 Tax=Pseudooceanicola albus TaxID=2692189 RepID=A0A6L7G3K6_9RHOB|nr:MULTISPECIES: penicillin-binding protein activator [Pseudooceanicola]MBT9384918.1 penicillin-binding protein activator [Pseudooceanicola endophyticus]MXN18087.1 ABC transporter substrate-binding protein [Pseudooceanicola albus]